MAAAVAEEAALVDAVAAAAVAVAASTNSDHLAASVFVVNGCDPLDV